MIQQEQVESHIPTTEQELSSSDMQRTARPVAAAFQFHSGLANTRKHTTSTCDQTERERDTDLDWLLHQDSSKLGLVEQDIASGSWPRAGTVSSAVKTQAPTTTEGDTADNLDHLLDELLD